jgi:uncharacterized protein YjbI with pentapeptide repeats
MKRVALSFPVKPWEGMTEEGRDHFYNLSEEELIARWNTPEGQTIFKNIVETNLNDGNSSDYQNFLGTIKMDFSRKARPKFDLRGIDFSNFSNLIDNEIRAFDFSNCALHYSNFRSSRFTSSSFANSDILYSDLSFSFLENCDFSGSNITLSDFSNCYLEDANFRDCWMSNANFKGADLSYITFNRGTNFRSLDVSSIEGAMNPLFANFVKKRLYWKNFREQGKLNKVLYYVVAHWRL